MIEMMSENILIAGVAIRWRNDLSVISGDASLYEWRLFKCDGILLGQVIDPQSIRKASRVFAESN